MRHPRQHIGEGSSLRELMDVDLQITFFECMLIPTNLSCSQLYASKALVCVGEVKSSSEGYKYGMKQIQKRLSLMKWAIRCL